LLPGNQILAIRRIVVQRNQHRKQPPRRGRGAAHSGKVTAAALIRSYQTEAQRQQLLVKKGELAQTRLSFVVNALRRLFADEEFLTLLRAETMESLPRPLAEQLDLPEALNA
jgi:ParB family chromosome partitioning protein